MDKVLHKSTDGNFGNSAVLRARKEFSQSVSVYSTWPSLCVSDEAFKSQAIIPKQVA